ncbi:MAG: SMI1/KNR4 family protein [Singulisphaera sp.]
MRSPLVDLVGRWVATVGIDPGRAPTPVALEAHFGPGKAPCRPGADPRQIEAWENRHGYRLTEGLRAWLVLSDGFYAGGPMIHPLSAIGPMVPFARVPELLVQPESWFELGNPNVETVCIDLAYHWPKGDCPIFTSGDDRARSRPRVIATSFEEWFLRVLHRGGREYWFEPGFFALGDPWSEHRRRPRRLACRVASDSRPGPGCRRGRPSGSALSRGTSRDPPPPPARPAHAGRRAGRADRRADVAPSRPRRPAYRALALRRLRARLCLGVRDRSGISRPPRPAWLDRLPRSSRRLPTSPALPWPWGWPDQPERFVSGSPTRRAVTARRGPVAEIAIQLFGTSRISGILIRDPPARLAPRRGRPRDRKLVAPTPGATPGPPTTTGPARSPFRRRETFGSLPTSCAACRWS